MIPDAWRRGVVAVVGLGKSGVAATTPLARERIRVYASDASDHPYSGAALAALRELAGVTLELGRHDLARIRAATAVIASPGVPPDAPPLAAARSAGVPVFAELDLGFRALVGSGTRCVAITGTNGKTTTTALVAHLLGVAGLDAAAAGNIGRPLADIAVRGERHQWLAVEVSSFQLHDSPDFAPDIGILTNLAPDHLDRYAGVEAYYADKRLLFRNAADRNVWVLNRDDATVLELAAGVKGRRVLFSLAHPADGWYDRIERRLRLGPHALLGRDELGLLGDHNVANALAAATASASRPGCVRSRHCRTAWSRCAKWAACCGSTIRRPRTLRPRSWRSRRCSGRSCCCSAGATKESPTRAWGACSPSAAGW
jgi:UDP-N-acetylmuramoylalanine--D-glutamate ligase